MKRSLFALALALALPLSAQAAQSSDKLDYSYVEGGYSSTHFLGYNFTGWNLKGSVGFNDMWYGSASYTSGSKNGVDLSETTVGVGLHTAISDKADFFAEAAYLADHINLGVSDHGYRVTGGVRGLLGDNVEGNIQLNYSDVNDFGKGWGAGAGLVYHINPTWGVLGSYDYSKRDFGGGFSKNLSTWNLGVRASF